MEKSQTKFLIGLAAGGVAVGAGFLTYNQVKLGADVVKIGSKIDASNITCNAAKTDAKAFKGDDGKYYKADKKLILTNASIKDDAKIIKYDGKIFKTDGIKYDAKPALAGDAKSFKNDDGKYLYSDGAKVAEVTADSKNLVKYDGKIFTKSDKALNANGPIFLIDNQQVVCTPDGQALGIDNAKLRTIVAELPLAS